MKRAIVLLEVPEGGEVRIDLAPFVPAPGGRCGFQGMPEGFHRIEVRGRDLKVHGWVFVQSNETQVRTCDQASGHLLATSRYRAAQVAGLRAEGELRLNEYPAEANACWRALVSPLASEGFPPAVRSDPPGKGSQFLRALEGTHGGEWGSFLQELAWSFLAGHLDQDAGAARRWRELFECTCAAGPLSATRNAELFLRVAELLPAQLSCLAEAERADLSGNLARLAADLAAAEDPALAAAGKGLVAS